MLTIHMVGLMYFNACNDGDKRVYVPNGTQGMDKIRPHYASLWIEEDKVVNDDVLVAEARPRAHVH